MEEEIQVPDELELEDVLTAPEKVSVVIERKSATPVEKEYWIRPPNEIEQSMSQSAARKIARELRERLEDEKSEEHELLIKDNLEEMTLPEMRLIWLTSNLFQKTFELNRRSLNDRDEFFVARPEGKENGVIPPTHAEMDQYEKDKKLSEKDRLVSLQEEQKRVFAQLKTQAEELNTEDLANVVQPLMIEQMIAEELNNQYGLQVLIRCTFLDPDLTKRAFQNTDQAKKMLNTKNGRKVLESLLSAHKGLMLDPDALKNSVGVLKSLG